MTPLAHGVDLVFVPRIERIWREHGERFLERVYTQGEREYCLRHAAPAVPLAGRFAVKEAVFKLLGTGWRGGIEWTDVETLPNPLGKPLVTLRGQSKQLAHESGIKNVLVSISHAGDYALASVIGWGG